MRAKLSLLFLLPLAIFILAACQPASPVQSPPEPLAPSETFIPTTANIPTDTEVPAEISPTPQPSSTPAAPDPPPTPAPTERVYEGVADFWEGRYSQAVELVNYSVPVAAFLNIDVNEMYDLNILQVRLSPDGAYLALIACVQPQSEASECGSYSSELPLPPYYLLLLDAASGEVLTEVTRTVPAEWTMLNEIAFSPDSSTLLYLIRPRQVVYWDLTSRAPLKTVLADQKSFLGSSIHPGMELLASSQGYLTSVYDLASGSLIQQLEPAYAPRFSEDGSTLLVYTSRNVDQVSLFDTSTWQPRGIIQVSPYPIIALSPDGSLLAEGSTETVEMVVTLWDVDTASILMELPQPFSVIDSVVFSPDNRLLLVGGLRDDSDFSRITAVWDVQSGELLDYFYNLKFYRGLTAYASDGSQFFAFNESNGAFGLYGLPGEQEIELQQRVNQYLQALSEQDYRTAAALFPPHQDMREMWLNAEDMDIPAEEALQVMCESPENACLPLLEILEMSSFGDSLYDVYVRLQAPDGSAFSGEFGDIFYLTFDISNPQEWQTINLPYR